MAKIPPPEREGLEDVRAIFESVWTAGASEGHSHWRNPSGLRFSVFHLMRSSGRDLCGGKYKYKERRGSSQNCMLHRVLHRIACQNFLDWRPTKDAGAVKSNQSALRFKKAGFVRDTSGASWNFEPDLIWRLER